MIVIAGDEHSKVLVKNIEKRICVVVVVVRMINLS